MEIDGSQKSGSGTIVRDAVPFAILRRENLHLFNIRARRDKPGLRAQHLTAVEACAGICQGRLEGAEVGSREIRFFPGEGIRGGTYRWDIGTAGSTTMLALSILPLALFADSPVRFRIVGGLFQDFAPSAFHLEHLLLPAVREMGARIEFRIVRPGYVPSGKGEIELFVHPLTLPLKPFVRKDPGKVKRVSGISLSSLLSDRKVSERMAERCQKRLKDAGLHPEIEIVQDRRESPAFEETSVQPGACLALWAETDTGCRIGADMAGARGRPAEEIGEKTAQFLLQDIRSGATVDRHLADQIIPFAALAEGVSRYRIPEMTDHVEARIWLIGRMLGAEAEVDGQTLKIRGIGYRRK